MKKIFMILVAALISMTAVFAQETQKNLAVSTFDVIGNAVSKEEAEFITDLYIGQLANRMYVYDRKSFDTILAEMKFQGGDWASPEKTVALGKATGANILGRGLIFKLGSCFYISTTIIDAKTAQILSSSQKPFKVIDDVPNLLISMAKEVSDKIKNAETKAESVSQQKRIAISTFEMKGNTFSKDEAEAITELYIGNIASTEKISVFDRKNFDKIIDEMKFQGGDWSSQEKTIELGKATGVTVLGRGQIFKLGSSFYISTTVIDVKSAEILSSSQKSFKNIGDVPNLLVAIAKETSDNLKNTETKSYTYGDTGPGGGTVYEISDDGEIFEFKKIGAGSLETAKQLCKNYKNGEFNDWYLPSEDDLESIYDYWDIFLEKDDSLPGEYWSSSINEDDGRPIMTNFSVEENEFESYYVKDNKTEYSVIAIRNSLFPTKKKIAVSTFEMKGDAFSKEEAEAITELFIGDIVSTGKCSVFDRKNFDKILDELKFQTSDWGASEKTVKLNQATGASVLGRGQIFKLGSSYYISTTMIDANTARILSSEQKTFTALDEVPTLLNPLALGVTQKISAGIINYAVGDKGPAGGIIFKVDGNMRWEVSGNLGSYTYDEACKLYQATEAPYYDWDLPSITEMNEVYENLVKTKLIGDLREFRTKGSYVFNLIQGTSRCVNDSNTHSVCLVRKFNINDKSPQTPPKNPYIGVYTASVTFGDVYRSLNDSLVSKYIMDNFDLTKPINFKLEIKNDGTYRIEFDYIGYTTQEDHKKKNLSSFYVSRVDRSGTWKIQKQSTSLGDELIPVFSCWIGYNGYYSEEDYKKDYIYKKIVRHDGYANPAKDSMLDCAIDLKNMQVKFRCIEVLTYVWNRKTEHFSCTESWPIIFTRTLTKVSN